jgi:hypothetical protein
MKRITIIVFLMFALGLSSQLTAQQSENGSDLSKIIKTSKFTPGWAIGIKASSFGFGGEIVKSFNEKFNLRLGGSYFKQNYNYTFVDGLDTKGINYSTVGAVSLIADWHFTNWFHLSGGVLYNMTELEIESKATESHQFGEIEVTPETIGSVYYRLNPNELCPYLGLGFGRTISKSKVVSFNFDLGAVYQGSPKVTLEATGMVSPTANESQRQLLEDNVNEYKFFPFINFQLGFRIF